MPSPATFLFPTSPLRVIIFAVVLLLPVGGASAQSAAPIAVTLTEYAFSPGALELKQGNAYQIHFLNSGSKSHSFRAPEFFADSQIAPEDMAKVKNGTVELDTGQSIDITVIPGRAGTYVFSCTHFMHKMMGMHGRIAVQ